MREFVLAPVNKAPRASWAGWPSPAHLQPLLLDPHPQLCRVTARELIGVVAWEGSGDSRKGISKCSIFSSKQGLQTTPKHSPPRHGMLLSSNLRQTNLISDPIEGQDRGLEPKRMPAFLTLFLTWDWPWCILFGIPIWYRSVPPNTLHRGTALSLAPLCL